MQIHGSHCTTGIHRRWRWHHETLIRLREILLGLREIEPVADRASGEMMHEVQFMSEEELTRQLREELARDDVEITEIDTALTRLRDGTYGICESRGTLILLERLREAPWTRNAERSEKRRVGSGCTLTSGSITSAE